MQRRCKKINYNSDNDLRVACFSNSKYSPQEVLPQGSNHQGRLTCRIEYIRNARVRRNGSHDHSRDKARILDLHWCLEPYE